MKKIIWLYIIYMILFNAMILASNLNSIEFICDNMDITTEAFNISQETNEREFVFLEADANVSNLQISLNRHSIMFVNKEGEYVSALTIEDEGDWVVLRDSGTIYFVPTEDFNGTSSIQYVINNNCDYPSGLSNEATAEVTINALSGSLPVIDGVCIFSEIGEAYDDYIKMQSNEKIKVMNVFDNDDSGLEDITKFVNASLRLIAPNQDIVRRIYIKNKGEWLANTNTGQVFFKADDNFIGEAQITYTMDSPCSYVGNKALFEESIGSYNAQIILVIPTPTPTPLPTVTPAPIADTITSFPENNTSVQTDEVVVKSDSATTFNGISIFLIGFALLWIGISSIRDEKFI